jgi:hypothetical protein
MILLLLTAIGLTNGSGRWYLWWSGFFADLTIFTLAYANWKKHNCHDHWCARIGRHPVLDGKYLVCRRHLNQILGLPKRHRLSVHHIRDEHRVNTTDGAFKDHVVAGEIITTGAEGPDGSHVA